MDVVALLPTPLIREIFLLLSNGQDRLHFRLTCRKWNQFARLFCKTMTIRNCAHLNNLALESLL
uniref:F-box protein n=1 Tax=Vibrio cholerae TaxID=666 RepID=UPI0018F068F1|nr:hypothetical protein [Vibrio cholerae]